MKLILNSLKWILCLLWRIVDTFRKLIVNLIFIVILILVLGYMLRDRPLPPKLPDNAALTLNLSGDLVEQRNDSDPTQALLQQFLGEESPTQQISLQQVQQTIEHAKNDPKIKMIVLQLDNLRQADLTKLRVIGQTIADFKQSHKPVIAIGDNFNQAQYYLASYADKILLNQAGGLMLQGYSISRLYYKDALEKFSIDTHVFRVGRYKSFVEPYLRNDMSEDSREVNRQLLEQLWQEYVQDVSSERHISTDILDPSQEELLARLQKVKGDSARYALDNHLVDQLATREQMIQELAKQVGWDEEHTRYRSIDYLRYLKSLPAPRVNLHEPGIALITASGPIVAGEQPSGVIGADTLSDLLQQARMDKQIKAVVLRIDSPGGSAFAAEQIRQQLLELKRADKPVVVSMSSYAASGGYWISADADKIVAEPTTLTGSIGVFGMFTTVDRALERLGVHNDEVHVSAYPKVGIAQPVSDTARQMIQLGVEDTYQRFVNIVAKGRKLPPETVDQIAQGHVWTGRDALKLGLVDQLGGQTDAVKLAASLAQLQDYQLVPIKPELTAREIFIQQLFDNISQIITPPARHDSLAARVLHSLSTAIAPMRTLNDPKGMYALMPIKVD